MPNNKSSAKRLRQDDKRNLRNRARKSEIRTLTKKVLAAVESGDQSKAEELARVVQGKLDRAAKGGTLHANTVSRRKSSLARQLKGE
ncbi:MAG: 30S ribosomal protein S20 [Planctomycetota bacterium]|nr:30S ribosomal protein S20 [Planctomycetota bacterium]